MNMPSKSDILSLSVVERIQLAEELWDSVREIPEAVPVSDAMKVELDHRIHALQQAPEAQASWEHVLARLRNRQ